MMRWSVDVLGAVVLTAAVLLFFYGVFMMSLEFTWWKGAEGWEQHICDLDRVVCLTPTPEASR